jgi:mannose-6-phosphate isomerase
MLLVKLLDAGQRLPVHAHPDGPFARAHLGTGHGKAEAWFILEAGDVYLGLLRDVAADELAALVDAQDARALLALLHRVPVRPGDTVMVPPGVLHAIGEGVLLAEVQEPEDLSILLEWRDFELDGARDGHLGLGFDTALQAVETRGRTADEIAALVSGGAEGDVLAPAAAPYFRFELLTVGEAEGGTTTTTTDAGFAVLIVLDGELTLHAQGDPDARPVAVKRGTTAVLPHAAGALTVAGEGRILLARPPRR